ncbi:UBA TS-N domain-containing protein [Rutstroemia sp. NJR-2017a BBW]|nr:UBA TS-N domain-containing protein [Rutstroemia sp. NJR-2017a BBW]
MAGILSKRQLARNEMALQELVKLPGNNVCADCQARNPGWASWSLGIFLCMRCAALHRKMGTHITKVKSLSMDSWSKEQVDHMKRVGNVASNRIYNPDNTRPPVPMDADEADSAMERFIRKKYSSGPPAQKRNNTGSTSSDDHPPPLPPKTGMKFGFRSASSIFPLSSKAKKETERVDFHEQENPVSPSKDSKQSRIFGESINTSDELESKMARLRDMGFTDEKRNITVLKGLGGNLEKSIETLVRLGEGSRSVSGQKPTSSTSSSGQRATTNPTSPTASTSTSNNPFDRLESPSFPQPQTSQSTGSMAQGHNHGMGTNPFQINTTTNPFGLMPSQSQLDLNQAFQNMSVSSSQPLFPHHTGGFPGPQPPALQQLYQQSLNPPVPAVPSRHYQPVIYENQVQQPPQQQNMNSNPFMQHQAPPANLQMNPFMQQSVMNQAMFNSPVTQSPQQQYPPGTFDMGGQHTSQQQMNPFFNQTNTQQQGMQPQYGYQQQMQPQMQLQQSQYDQYRQQTYPLMSQPTGMVDKRGIMDLFNQPQLAPIAQQVPQQPAASQAQGQMQSFEASQQANAQMAGGSRNPFMSSGGGGASMGNDMSSGPKQSRESMLIDAGGWQNGRHSPDAWGTISGRR